MSIKYEIREKAHDGEQFPAFYILKPIITGQTKYIILVTGRENGSYIGTVVTTGDRHDLGSTSDHWDVKQFERLYGSFTVTQD